MSLSKDQKAVARLRYLTGWQAGKIVRPIIVTEIQHQTIRRRPSAQAPVRQEVL